MIVILTDSWSSVLIVVLMTDSSVRLVHGLRQDQRDPVTQNNYQKTQSDQCDPVKQNTEFIFTKKPTYPRDQCDQRVQFL